MKLHPRWAPALSGLVLSGLMSLLVSGIATVRAIGVDHGLPAAWRTAWLSSWAVAFPAVMFLAPLTRRLVAGLIDEGAPAQGRKRIE